MRRARITPRSTRTTTPRGIDQACGPAGPQARRPAGLPGSGRRGLAREVPEVARRAAQDLLDAVREVGVAAVEEALEEVDEELDLLGRHPESGEVVAVLARRHRDVGELAARRLRDLRDRLAEGQQTGPGDGDLLADVPVARRQRGDHDVRDVPYVDERLAHLTGREHQLPMDQPLHQRSLAEVL